jgi:predicted nucleotidyltransferase
MKDWEKATKNFLKKWRNKKEVVGALVCGSYVTGRPTENSDIDIHIILDDSCTWRQKGNEIVDGFLIEYFVNPPHQIKKYFESDYQNNKIIDAHMFVTGKILFDRTGDVKKLAEEAKRYMKKPFKKPNKSMNEINKYGLWDLQDNLEEVYKRGKNDFSYVYFNVLHETFQYYSKYLGYHSVSINRVRRFLTEKKDQEKYMIPEFPDKKFVTLFIKAMEETDREKMFEYSKKISKHVLNGMGGLEVDGWSIKTPTESSGE